MQVLQMSHASEWGEAAAAEPCLWAQEQQSIIQTLVQIWSKDTHTPSRTRGHAAPGEERCT
eukprot:1157607-Pelagomonas_calceolata.AAC.4